MSESRENAAANRSGLRHLSSQRLDPLTAVGGVVVLVAATALITYGLLTVPGKMIAQQGPPQEFIDAATEQASGDQALPTSESDSGDLTPSPQADTDSGVNITPQSEIAPNPIYPTVEPTANPFGEWPLPDWVDERYWLTIPILNLDAPIIALSPRAHQVDGQTVQRLPVPNSYAVSWDETSAEPGFTGNTVLTGHSNLYGGVFSRLSELAYGAEIAIWSEYGVHSYYVSNIVYLDENDQPLDVRLKNADWLNDSPEDRLTIITCWPNSNSAQRLIIVAHP